MKLVSASQKSDSYILRLDPKEEFLECVQNFCREKEVNEAWVQAVGSTEKLELAYYDIEEKKYKTKEFSEFLEILNITGNVAVKEGEVFCHAHGMFGRLDMSTLGGHVNECVVSATAEVFISTGGGSVKRSFDEKTGLHLLE